MRSWTIAQRIMLGFAGLIGIALALGALSHRKLAAIQGNADELAGKSQPAIELIYQTQAASRNQVQLAYKHLGSQDREDMASLEAAVAAGSSQIAQFYGQLDKLIASPKARDLLDKVMAARAVNNQRRTEVLAMSRQTANKTQAYDLARSQYDPAMQHYVEAQNALIDLLRSEANGQSLNIQSAVQSLNQASIIGLCLTSFLGAAIAFVIIRSVRRILHPVCSSLHVGSDQVAAAAAQLSSGSQTLASGASEQAASLEEASASLEEMSSMTKRNAGHAQRAHDLAKGARAAADKGSSDMQAVSSAMNAIKASSDRIAKIITTIDEIAFQTNILALNAAVEAARAGESGLGFAVVADEVRNLAQRSAHAAKETAAIIEDAIIQTGRGVEITSKVGLVLNEIVVKTRQVDELVGEVATASGEQNQGISQINTATVQMDKITQSNAAHAEESAAVAEELRNQSEVMQHHVAELLKLVGGPRPGGLEAVPEHRVYTDGHAGHSPSRRHRVEREYSPVN